MNWICFHFDKICLKNELSGGCYPLRDVKEKESVVLHSIAVFGKNKIIDIQLVSIVLLSIFFEGKTMGFVI